MSLASFILAGVPCCVCPGEAAYHNLAQNTHLNITKLILDQIVKNHLTYSLRPIGGRVYVAKTVRCGRREFALKRRN